MNEQAITSSHNPKYRRWLSLLESKGIKKEGLALVSGEKLVRELFAENPGLIREVLLPPKAEWSFAIPRAYRLTSPMFKALDVLGTHFPIAVVDAPHPETWDSMQAPRGMEAIVALQDPANLGALLRSCEAFGVSRVILTKECSSPFLPKALKAASLSTFRLKLAVTGALNEIGLAGHEALALDMDGEAIHTLTWPRNFYLILGEEGQGLPKNLKVRRIHIPMRGRTESLNATVAASIALFSAQLAHSNSR